MEVFADDVWVAHKGISYGVDGTGWAGVLLCQRTPIKGIPTGNTVM
jgi:hypothetical protein